MTRTRDLLITNQLLYQLSYAGQAGNPDPTMPGEPPGMAESSRPENVTLEARVGLMDFVSGELIEIIEWTDDSHDTLAFRFPDQDHAIKRGAQLIVRESQVAQFVPRRVRRYLHARSRGSAGSTGRGAASCVSSSSSLVA